MGDSCEDETSTKLSGKGYKDYRTFDGKGQALPT